MREKWLPHPLSSAALALFWLWLNNTVGPGQVLLGAFLGWSLPLFSRRFWPERERVSKPWRLLPFALVVLADVVTANLRVARAVLGPVAHLRPGFARVPLDLRSDIGIAVLANTVTLTPGTLSADLSEDRRELVVHYLDEPDPGQLVALIKARYERPILEVFG
ncbi:MAG: cation antiporter [Proteobacteria bacterium]|nr:cation antiporter [Pseudomonadota bacterium]